MEEANKDYFELKYLEEISQLFTQLKGMNNYYKLGLFNTQNYTEFFDFIQNHVIMSPMNLRFEILRHCQLLQ